MVIYRFLIFSVMILFLNTNLVFADEVEDSLKNFIGNLGGQMNNPTSSSTAFPKGYKYLLGPEDMLEVSVWGNKDLTTLMPVRPDGTISYPLIGDIMAKGLTPQELKEKITSKIRYFITDASVTVIVKEIKSIKVSVSGEVNLPGTYNVNRPMTLLHLLSLVQGFTKEADLKKAYLLRNGKKLEIDFFALLKGGNFAHNVWVQDSDFIHVPNNFESRINIMGEVVMPQVITYQDGMTVLDAVLIAQGLTEIARPKVTKVYRRNKVDGKIQIKKILVELDKVIFEGDLSRNLSLKPGDIIHIPRSFF